MADSRDQFRADHRSTPIGKQIDERHAAPANDTDRLHLDNAGMVILLLAAVWLGRKPPEFFLEDVFRRTPAGSGSGIRHASLAAALPVSPLPVPVVNA
jgi:hypothetical protein